MRDYRAPIGLQTDVSARQHGTEKKIRIIRCQYARSACVENCRRTQIDALLRQKTQVRRRLGQVRWRLDVQSNVSARRAEGAIDMNAACALKSYGRTGVRTDQRSGTYGQLPRICGAHAAANG